jgi:hypothetical protein
VTLPSGTPTVLPTSRPTITVTRPKYHVSLATFAGGWTAHTRFLRISRAGVGKEWVDDGCCHHEFHLTFELSRVWGSPDNAIAEFVITAFTPGEPGYFDAQHPAPRVGQKGQLRVREHTIVETATDTRFCSDGHALPQPNVCGV